MSLPILRLTTTKEVHVGFPTDVMKYGKVFYDLKRRRYVPVEDKKEAYHVLRFSIPVMDYETQDIKVWYLSLTTLKEIYKIYHTYDVLPDLTLKLDSTKRVIIVVLQSCRGWTRHLYDIKSIMSQTQDLLNVKSELCPNKFLVSDNFWDRFVIGITRMQLLMEE